VILAKAIRRWMSVSDAHPGAVLASFAVLAAFSGLLATRIHVDPDLEGLLPRNSPTIRAMRETKARYGSSDLYTVSIVAKDPVLIASVQDRIVKHMRATWPDIVFVQDDRDASFFREHALLYLPIPYLENLIHRLGATRDEIRRGPLGIDLLGDAPAKGPWFDATLPQQLGLPDEAADEFEKFIKPPDLSTRQDRNAIDPKAGIPQSLQSRLIGSLGTGRYVGVVQAVLKKPSSDIAYVRTVLTRSDEMLDPLRKELGSEIQVGVEGPYKDFRELESLSSNGTRATVVSVALTVLLVLVFFRRAGPIFLVVGQAGISCLLTLGFAALCYGRLNLYTMFVIAILFGMGTDYSFYLFGYAQRLVQKGKSWEAALEQALLDMSASLFASAATTVAGLLTLLSSRFAGFFEFGVIAAFGISTSFALTYLLLPSGVLLGHKLSLHRGFGWLMLDLKPAKSIPMAPAWLPRFSSITAGLAIVGAIALVPFALHVGFEYDFDQLRDTRPSAPGLPVREALNSKRTSSQPVVVLANNPASMDALHDTLLRRLTVDRDTLLRSFLTLRSFVPSTKDQEDRIPYLKRLDRVLSDKVFNKASGDDSAMVAMLRRQVRAHPFGPQDIPEWALNMLRERDSTYGRIGFVYGRFNNSDSREAAKFESRYGHLEAGGEKLSCFSTSFVYADVVRLVREDSVRMSLLMLGILVVLLALLLRKPRAIAVCIIGMVACLAWILGLMGLFGMKVGVFNLIDITTIQAALTDVVIYLVLAWERGGRRDLLDLYTGIGTLMTVAIGTTITGYAGMCFTTHLGIRSMGNFAVLGLGSCLVISFALTPWLCQRLLPPTKSPRDAAQAGTN
jgi:hypothetical protein